MLRNLFEEVQSIQENRDLEKAQEYYNTIVKLQYENYEVYEQNQKYFANLKENYHKYIQHEFKPKNTYMSDNFTNMHKSFEAGRIISEKFKFLNIQQLHRIPEHIQLPQWFDSFKIEELGKVRDQLNAYALRLYKSRINTAIVNQRKKLKEIIEKKIVEIDKKYQDEQNPPVSDLNSLQQYIEDLQFVDRVIPELAFNIVQKAQEYAERMLHNFMEFRDKSQQLYQQ